MLHLAFMNNYWNGFVDLIFPRMCLGCGAKLYESEDYLCLVCVSDLPRCRFNSLKENIAARQFWGRLNLSFVNCFCFHTGTGVFPQILHHLKYKNCPDLGVYLGAIFGKELKALLMEQKVNWLIPIPLHPSRERKRGYNQSECIAKGIHQITGTPLNTDWLLRHSKGRSQTLKNRMKRHTDAQSLYELHLPIEHQKDHFVLVDDVITTGATIEACAQLFERYPGCQVSVLSLAYTWS